MDKLRAWYFGLSLRERRLVLLMIAVAVPVLLWLAVWRPVAAAHDEALDRYRMALDRNGRIAAMTGVAAGEQRPAPVIDGSLAAWLLAHATEQGLVLARNEDLSDVRAEVEMGAAGAADIARWLGALEAEGLRIENVRLAPSPNGGVAMTATVGRPQ